MKGTVKWFNNQKGYGFIVGEDEKEYFAHYTKIEKEGFKSLNEGQEVTFEVEDSEKGPQATNIVPA